jgi:hypothetical protein
MVGMRPERGRNDEPRTINASARERSLVNAVIHEDLVRHESGLLRHATEDSLDPLRVSCGVAAATSDVAPLQCQMAAPAPRMRARRSLEPRDVCFVAGGPLSHSYNPRKNQLDEQIQNCSADTASGARSARQVRAGMASVQPRLAGPSGPPVRLCGSADHELAGGSAGPTCPRARSATRTPSATCARA